VPGDREYLHILALPIRAYTCTVAVRYLWVGALRLLGELTVIMAARLVAFENPHSSSRIHDSPPISQHVPQQLTLGLLVSHLYIEPCYTALLLATYR